MVVSGMVMVLSSLVNQEEHKATVAMPYQNRLPPRATVPSKALSESWVLTLSQSKSTGNDKKARFSPSRFHPQRVRGCRRSAREMVAPFSLETASTLSFAMCDTCTSTAPAILFLMCGTRTRTGSSSSLTYLGKAFVFRLSSFLPFFRPFFNSFPVLCQLEHDEVPVQVTTLRATPCPSARPSHRKRCHPSQTWPYQKKKTPNNKLVILMSP